MKQWSLIVFLFPIPCLAQTIDGPDKANKGDLVKLVPADVNESRILWMLNSPADFGQWSAEGDKLFLAMPGHDVSFSLVVIPNDTNEALSTIRHVISPNDSEKPEDPVGPDTPADPPADPLRNSPFYKLASEEYAKIEAEDKLVRAGMLRNAFNMMAAKITAGDFEESEDGLNDMFISLRAIFAGDVEAWRPWESFNNAFKSEADDLIKAGALPSDFEVPCRAVALALED